MNLFKKETSKFTELYSDYYPVVFNCIYSKVNDPDTAGDLTQEVFIRFYEKIDEIEKPRQWLFGTLRYVVMEHYRKKRGDDVDIEDVFNDSNMQFVNGFRDTRIIIQEALEDSSNYKDEKEQILFELIAINNYTYSEVAQQLGYTVRQVRYRYTMIVERIIDHLRKKGVGNLEDLV